MLDLLTSKLRRITGNTVSWTEVQNPSHQVVVPSSEGTLASVRNLVSNQNLIVNQKPLVTNQKTVSSKPVVVVPQQLPHKLSSLKVSHEEKIDSSAAESCNPVRRQAFKLDKPGVQPDFRLLRVGSVLGNPRYYLISKVAILGSNKPVEPVFQSEDTGLFYNNLGFCLRTDSSSRLLVYQTKLGQYRYAPWAQKGSIKDVDNLIPLSKEIRDEIVCHEAMQDYSVILNPDYKSGKVKRPRLITLKPDGKRLERSEDPLYFSKIEELAYLRRVMARSKKESSKISSQVEEESDMDISEGGDFFNVEVEDATLSDFDPEVEHIMG